MGSHAKYNNIEPNDTQHNNAQNEANQHNDTCSNNAQLKMFNKMMLNLRMFSITMNSIMTINLIYPLYVIMILT
jgi:hypothetical protein